MRRPIPDDSGAWRRAQQPTPYCEQAIRRACCFSAGLIDLYLARYVCRWAGVSEIQISDALFFLLSGLGSGAGFRCAEGVDRDGLSRRGTWRVTAGDEVLGGGLATSPRSVPVGVEPVDERSELVPIVTVGAAELPDGVDAADDGEDDGFGSSSAPPPREHDPISNETAKMPTALLAVTATGVFRSD